MTQRITAGVFHKGDTIINPNTNRGVKIGSKTWRSLVKQGLVSGAYKNTPIEKNIMLETDDPDEIEAKKKFYSEPENKEEHENITKVKTKNGTKLVKRNKPLKPEEVVVHTARIASRALKQGKLKHIEDDELDKHLESIIAEELIKNKKKAPRKKSVKVKEPHNEIEIENENECSSADEW